MVSSSVLLQKLVVKRTVKNKIVDLIVATIADIGFVNKKIMYKPIKICNRYNRFHKFVTYNTTLQKNGPDPFLVCCITE